MIRYALRCTTDHNWDAWFPSSDGYESQVARGLVECPVCGSRDVRKAPMAPAVVTVKSQRPSPPEGLPIPAASEPDLKLPEPVRAFLDEWRQHIASNYDYVGDRFAREARAIHEGESEERLIYGDVTPEDARALIEDGVPVAPIPPMASPQAAKKLS